MASAILIKEPPNLQSQGQGGVEGTVTTHRWIPVSKVDYELDKRHKFIPWGQWCKLCEDHAVNNESGFWGNKHIYTVIRNNTCPNGQLHRLNFAHTGGNATKNLLLYNCVKYMTYSSSIDKFSHIYFSGPNSAEACSNGAITQNATESHFSSTATYTAPGGGTTVTEVHLCNSNATPSTSNEYADYTDATFPQAMAAAETMGVTWTYTWNQGTNLYCDAVNRNLLYNIAYMFKNGFLDIAILPVGRSWIVDTGTYETNYYNFSGVYAGGGSTDVYTTWEGVHTQSAGTYTVDRVSTTYATGGTYDDTDGRQYWGTAAEAWASGATLTIRYTITWSTP